jgi:diguanylate cyclase (GGDEF)-like protein
MLHWHAHPVEAEEARLRALHALDLRGDSPEQALEALAALAAQLLGCPMSMVTMIDRAHYQVIAGVGAGRGEGDRALAFCQHAIASQELLVVPDATRESRFADNPSVTGDMHVRFYAGMPICARDPETGDPQRVGAICAVDTVPRSISAAQAAAMTHLAQLAEAILSARTKSIQSLELAALAQRQAQDLQRSVLAFDQAERIAAIGSWRYGMSDGAMDWSRGVYRIHDLEHDTGIKVDLAFGLSFYPEDARKIVQQNLGRAAVAGQPFDFETDFRTATGRLRRVRCLGEPVIVDGAPVALSGVFQDVTDRFQMEQSLRRMADLDEMTGLANRAAFNRELEAAVDCAVRESTPLLLILADLDRFKPINDEHGHDAGDEVLRIVGRRLRELCGQDCTAARLGGDEFALIVRGAATCDDPAPFVATLLDQLSRPAITSYGTLPISATIGYGLFERYRDLTLREFVHRIDSALYDAKRRGRGTARRFVDHGRRYEDPER